MTNALTNYNPMNISKIILYIKGNEFGEKEQAN